MKLLKLAPLALGIGIMAVGVPLAVKSFYPRTAEGLPAPSGTANSLLPGPKMSGQQAATKFANVEAARPVGGLPTPSAVALAVIATPEPRKAEPAAVAATPRPTLVYRAEVAAAQEQLNALGFDTGTPDGKLGPKTKGALAVFQEKHGLSATGEADDATLARIATVAAESVPAQPETAPAQPEKLIASAPAPTVSAVASSNDADADPQFVVLSKSAPAAVAVSSTLAPDTGPVPRLTTVADVKRLQERLAAAGTYTGEVDGKWGALSRDALKAFQETNQLPATGKPDKKTWLALNQTSTTPGGKSPIEIALASRQRTTDVRIENAVNQGISARDLREDAPDGVASAAKLAAEAAAATARAAREPEPAVALTPEKIQAAEDAAGIRKLVGPGAPAGEPAAAKSEAEAVAAEPVAPVAPVVAVPVEEPASAPPVSLDLSRPSAEPKSLEVSVPAETAVPPAAEASTPPVAIVPGEEIVIRVNADAGASGTGPLATPAAVSLALTGSLGGEQARSVTLEGAPEPFAPSSAAPGAAQAAPARASAPLVPPGGEGEFATLPPLSSAAKKSDKETAAAPAVRVENTAKARILEEEFAQTETRVAMVRNDSRYEIEKYAPGRLREIEATIAQTQREAANAEATRAALRKADDELEDLKREALRKKAGQKVDEVAAAYKVLKDKYGDQVRKEPLADTMGKIDAGYKAMKDDFRKGNYDPIVERCDGFKLAIEMLSNDAAKMFVDDKLGSRTVKSKLSKSELAAIEKLRGQNKHAEAAELLSSKTESSARPTSRSTKSRG